MALSRERIAAELLKLLVAPDAVATVALMVENGILRPVLPEITQADRLADLAATEAKAGIAPDPIRRLAALMPREPALGEEIAARLRLSKAQRQRLVLALTTHSSEPFELAYPQGRDAAIDWCLLSGDPDAPRHLRDWTIPRLPLTGGALVARGLRKGPEVAATLKRVEARWVAEGFPGQARADMLADEEVAGALRSASSANAASGSSACEK